MRPKRVPEGAGCLLDHGGGGLVRDAIMPARLVAHAFTDVSERPRELRADHAQRRSWPGSGAAASQNVQFADLYGQSLPVMGPS
jgi:hypothetical protein